MKNLLLSVVIVITCYSTSGQKQKLGFNLINGETYYQSMQLASGIKQEVNGQKINIDITVSDKMAYKVTGIKDTVYDMEVSYEQLEMTMKLPNGDIAFTSEKNDENDILSSILGAIKDKPFLMKMSKIGKILEIKNIDTIFENAFYKFPNFTPAQKQQLKDQILQAYGEKAFKGSFEMVTAIYSNSPVDKGSSWTIRTQLESGMAATLITTYKFKDKTDSYNLLIGSGKLATANKDAYIQVNGMPTKYNLTGTMNSTLKVDRKTGWIIEAKINQVLTGNVEIKDNPNLPGGLTTPMLLESEMTYSSKQN